jgi:hypothetical protein
VAPMLITLFDTYRHSVAFFVSEDNFPNLRT